MACIHPPECAHMCRHPFNCEPPPEVLMKRGMMTPVSLHYVRNHGPVPRLEWGSHRVSVGGLVSRPRSFSMDELVSLPSATITSTLVSWLQLHSESCGSKAMHPATLALVLPLARSSR